MATAGRITKIHPQWRVSFDGVDQGPLPRIGETADLPYLTERIHRLLVHGEDRRADVAVRFDPIREMVPERDRDGVVRLKDDGSPRMIPGRIIGARPVRSLSTARRASDNHGHRVTMRIATGAVAAGWSYQQFERVMLETDSGGRAHVHKIALKGLGRAQRYLEKVWAKATGWVASEGERGDRQACALELVEFRARVEAYPWKGLAGRTDKKNLMYRLDLAEDLKSFIHDASERDIAVGICASRTTVHASNQRLTGTWLRVITLGKGKSAHRWELTDGTAGLESSAANDPQDVCQDWATEGRLTDTPPARCGPVLAHRRSEALSDVQPHTDSRTEARVMAEDAFAFLGLGTSALVMLGALADPDHPAQTLSDVMGRATVSRRTAYRRLAQLMDHGLVDHIGETYQLTAKARRALASPQTSTVWQDIAEAEGTAGTTARRVAVHDAQRKQHRDRLDELAQKRADRAARKAAHDRTPATSTPRPDVADRALVTADGAVVDPVTGEIIPDLYVAEDGRWVWHDDLTHADLTTRLHAARAAYDAEENAA
ncbi:hypothetical protein AB0G95_21695 [Streptomyces virginiae]|uniref:hypothetical protein n=1 Tax=Streptomyces virginiae TaxID=1961 RepID=UPI003442C232